MQFRISGNMIYRNPFSEVPMLLSFGTFKDAFYSHGFIDYILHEYWDIEIALCQIMIFYIFLKSLKSNK